jgi:hypothetical protein
MDEAGASSAPQAEPAQGDSAGQGKKPDQEKPKFKDQELLVRFKKGVGKEDAKAVHVKHGTQVLRSYAMPEGLYLVKIAKGHSLGKVMAAYKATRFSTLSRTMFTLPRRHPTTRRSQVSGG